jgi:ATP-binding cassette subfamily B (MDR/TAP) protein 1
LHPFNAFPFLAFSFGTTLINEGHASPGIVINVFMAILIGSFSLAMLAPEMQGKPS